MLLSYFIGQKKYPIPYDLKSIGLYCTLAVLLFAAYTCLDRTGLGPVPRMALGTLLLALYALVVWRRDLRRQG
jgi:hypothetical protein